VEDLRLNLIRMGALSEFRLAGLGSSSVLQTVQHVAGPRPGAPAFSRRLHRTTGGNPFYLLEILRVLLDSERFPPDLAALEQFPLPDTVRQAVEDRLRRLSPQTRQVLEAGAVLGLSFDFDLVRRTAGRDEIETIDALDEAVARQILIENPSGYRFQHAVTRQTLETTMGPVRRHLLHRRAARALEHRDPQPVERIARHYDLGGERQKALHYYHSVAQQAKDLSAWQQTEAIQSRMPELLD
jgi:predicted ATPase